jgi:hypothetical protein
MLRTQRPVEWAALAALALGITIGVACSYSLEVGPCKITCASPGDCPGGQRCLGGRCQSDEVDRCGSMPDGSTGGSACPMACTQGTVCCPAPYGCAGSCVVDCRPMPLGCMNNDVCNTETGVCVPAGSMGRDAGGRDGNDAAASCGGSSCPPGQVCCPSNLGCANTCVPDCRATGAPACMSGFTCKQTNGVCTPNGQ